MAPTSLLVDSLIPEYGGNLFNIDGIEDRLRVNIADVRDEHSMDYLVRGQDVIFNLAGQVSHLDCMRDPVHRPGDQRRSQLSILEACRKNNPASRSSSPARARSTAGRTTCRWTSATCVHPTDVNGINKMAGEWYHIVYNNVYGMRATSLRLTNTYGPRMLVKNDRQTSLGWFIRLALDGEEIQIFGDGQQMRDFTYVDDVVDAFLLAGASDAANGEVFNLGGPEPVSLCELAAHAVRGRWARPAIAWCRSPPSASAIDIGDFYADYTQDPRQAGLAAQGRPRCARASMRTTASLLPTAR